MRMGLRPHLVAPRRGRTAPLRRGTWMGGWGVLPMGTTADLGDHHGFPTRLARRTLAMSHDSHHHDDVPPSSPTDHGLPQAARAANLLVGDHGGSAADRARGGRGLGLKQCTFGSGPWSASPSGFSSFEPRVGAVGVRHGPPNALDAPNPTSIGRHYERVGRARRRACRARSAERGRCGSMDIINEARPALRRTYSTAHPPRRSLR
jgi:hypothetical protein